ncbi:HEPN domain-containing protein [Arachidicoccus soli]|uniref:HEPN domain-containing protein n=1 Tax=Arachidicoccus soli TaxID=2341117 RepID=A0A386HUP2_9BACT|nr:HEPN domain-containing protein [Arachidicoccus soli]AYD49156.1 HEPN domain-containing protein [Arachidicoccus soli]
MNKPLNTEVQKVLDKAIEALENAEYDLNGGFTLATANRAYYACYYCMTALLYTKDVYAKTHQGVKTKFTELFIKNGLIPQKASDIASLLFDNRQNADYDFDAEITTEEADNLIKQARTFLLLTEEYLSDLFGPKL